MNRLDEFKKRTSAMPPADDTAIDNKEGRHVTINVGSPEPLESPEDQKMEMSTFYEQVKEVEASIHKIESYSENIEKQHSEAINTVNENQRQICSQKLETLVSAVTQATNVARVTLKTMDARNKELEGVAAKGSGSFRIRVTKSRQLVDRFTKVMKKFKKVQEKYNEKYKQQLERQVKIVNPSISKDEMHKILEDPEGARQMIFDISKKKVAQKDLEQMKDRYEDVKKIAQSIADLQQMFMEMDDMITQQGDVINRIENSADMIEDFTEAATENLDSAAESQKSIQKKKWLMIVLIIVGVIAVLLIISIIFKNLGLKSLMKKSKAPKA